MNEFPNQDGTAEMPVSPEEGWYGAEGSRGAGTERGLLHGSAAMFAEDAEGSGSRSRPCSRENKHSDLSF